MHSNRLGLNRPKSMTRPVCRTKQGQCVSLDLKKIDEESETTKMVCSRSEEWEKTKKQLCEFVE